jgi:hypothetical protein
MHLFSTLHHLRHIGTFQLVPYPWLLPVPFGWLDHVACLAGSLPYLNLSVLYARKHQALYYLSFLILLSATHEALRDSPVKLR